MAQYMQVGSRNIDITGLNPQQVRAVKSAASNGRSSRDSINVARGFQSAGPIGQHQGGSILPNGGPPMTTLPQPGTMTGNTLNPTAGQQAPFNMAPQPDQGFQNTMPAPEAPMNTLPAQGNLPAGVLNGFQQGVGNSAPMNTLPYQTSMPGGTIQQAGNGMLPGAEGNNTLPQPGSMQIPRGIRTQVNPRVRSNRNVRLPQQYSHTPDTILNAAYKRIYG